ncbi:GIY-YIG nuclease family protein [Mesobacillus zeae]|uniref:GIY-YIG nuclease family protein n=1 Tax=Mesobacillus zeae TaxID=1917180 RepID=A0A398B2J0_9BACI|nr:GIY-YIG nuclease family protein [Mesobacillus zeae]RID84149.1 GIY-YIG nuclease family protein [Mesobacillus zeae]
MEIQFNESHILYSIHLYVENNQKIIIGKKGSYSFNRGLYIYVGSAKRNILARINRHMKREKPFRWHFDYLRPHGNIVKIITYDSSYKECELAEKIRKETGGLLPVPEFGSSDCRCPSHLIYIADPPISKH